MREDGKYRILLADDDRGLCAVLQAYLDLQPDLCCCAVAYNGLHALEKTRQQKPDLVLLDIQMPGLNGADFMAELSSSPGLSEVRVLAFTAYDQALVTREMLRLGACGVLQKPYPLEMLMRRIRSLLQNRQPAQDMTPQRGGHSASWLWCAYRPCGLLLSSADFATVSRRRRAGVYHRGAVPPHLQDAWLIWLRQCGTGDTRRSEAHF